MMVDASLVVTVDSDGVPPQAVGSSATAIKTNENLTFGFTNLPFEPAGPAMGVSLPAAALQRGCLGGTLFD